MASGEAEPLQYTTTVLRVSIHCEGCKKKVKKVLHGIEGVYKVTVDAAQHKVTVTGSVGADGLIRRLNKAGKQAALWPAPTEAENKKPEEVTAATGEGSKGVVVVVAEKADAKPKDKGADKPQGEAEEGAVAKKGEKVDSKGSSEKKVDNKASDKKPEKAEVAKQQKDDGKKQGNNEAAEAKEKKSSPEKPTKEAAAAAADEASGAEDGGSANKKGGKKKKNKQQQQKDNGAESDAPATEKKPDPHPAIPSPAASPPPPPPVQEFPSPERPHFPYYAAQPVLSYNVAHPSASVSYYAPTPALPLSPPPPHHVPYGYPPPYPHMMPPPPPPEYVYGPPGMRASPPHESYNNMFHEDNANSCSLM